MKKILAALAAFCCLVSCAVPAVAAAAEETEAKISPDAVVRDAIEELEETDEFRFEKRALYDLSLEETGFLYDIEIGDRRGFLVLLETESGYEVAEYYADAENPYKDARRPVYGGFLNYLEIIGNFFYDAVTGKPVARLYGDFNVSAGSRTQKIEYSKKSEASYKISRGLPSYMQTSYENSCANIAGGIVVGYYDSFYDDLLPAYTAYSGGRWTAESSATRNLIDTLYYDMKTNVYGGTTYENFKTGLSAYVARRGRNISYSSLASGNTLNFSAFESTVKNGKPVVLFVDRYNAISSIAQANGYDMMVTNYYSGNHTMVAYGYRNVEYYRTETKSVWSPVWYNPFRFVKETEEVKYRTDRYINVRTVISSLPDGYIRLYDSCTLDYALAVNIW